MTGLRSSIFGAVKLSTIVCVIAYGKQRYGQRTRRSPYVPIYKKSDKIECGNNRTMS